MQIIDILGTKYVIEYMDEVILDNELVGGLCNFKDKQIHISTDESGDPERILRHEVAHAFLYESGLGYYASDENLVEWIAIQLPKIVKALDNIKE